MERNRQTRRTLKRKALGSTHSRKAQKMARKGDLGATCSTTMSFRERKYEERMTDLGEVV